MAGAEFKITDAIDPNIVKKLNEIRINIQTTSSEYANFTKQLSDGINFKPGNLREYQSKVDILSQLHLCIVKRMHKHKVWTISHIGH